MVERYTVERSLLSRFGTLSFHHIYVCAHFVFYYHCAISWLNGFLLTDQEKSDTGVNKVKNWNSHNSWLPLTL